MDQWGYVDDFEPQGLVQVGDLLQYDAGLDVLMGDLMPMLNQPLEPAIPPPLQVEQPPVLAQLQAPYYPPPGQPIAVPVQPQQEFVAPVQQPPQQQQPIADLNPIRVWVQPPGLDPNQRAHHRRVVRHRCPVCNFESGRAADCIDHIGQIHKAGETHLCPDPECGHWARNRASLFSHARAIHNSSVKWKQNKPIGLQPIKRRHPVDSEEEEGDD